MVEGVRVGPHCSGVKLIGCPYKFHHIAGKKGKKQHWLCTHCVPMFGHAAVWELNVSSISEVVWQIRFRACAQFKIWTVFEREKHLNRSSFRV